MAGFLFSLLGSFLLLYLNVYAILSSSDGFKEDEAAFLLPKWDEARFTAFLWNYS